MSRYQIINASESVFNHTAGAKGDGMVQPNTQRVLEIEEDLTDSYLERQASSGVFIKKTNAAAQNGEPLPGLDVQIATARNRLMVAAGQEREDIVAELRGERKASKASTSAAKAEAASPATSAAPSTTPPPAAATGPASPSPTAAR